MSISENLQKIKSKLPGQVCLVAVSKTKPNAAIMEVYQAGQRVFGENKAQEMLAKYEALPKDIKWHMIGTLQSNKVKYIAPFVDLIHSVDKEKLLKEIDKRAKANKRIINCLLQVHIADEESKFGFSAQELLQLVYSGNLGKYENVRIVGLMGMATNTSDESKVTVEFQSLNQLYKKLKSEYFTEEGNFNILSMGMSQDYPIAIEQGSNMVRIGSSIFGSRNYP